MSSLLQTLRARVLLFHSLTFPCPTILYYLSLCHFLVYIYTPIIIPGLTNYQQQEKEWKENCSWISLRTVEREGIDRTKKFLILLHTQFCLFSFIRCPAFFLPSLSLLHYCSCNTAIPAYFRYFPVTSKDAFAFCLFSPKFLGLLETTFFIKK